ncbi:MAG: GGDEF domain-containing protein [Spirochaetales bacterium]|nr:GGDEF domain-containing protein [Spirochaetales bacterium]
MMNLFDTRTVIFSYAISNFICLVVMAVLWSRNRRRFPGIGFWLADFALQFVGLLFLALRDTLPDFLSVLIGNPMLIGGTVLLFMGLERFAGRRGPWWPNAFIFAAYIGLQACFYFFAPGIQARTILFSAALVAICFQCVWLMLVRPEPGFRPVTRGVGVVFAVFGVVSLARIVVSAALPRPGEDFFHSNLFETALLLVYQMFYIVLTFSLSLMVNARLFRDLERDMEGRARAEKILILRLELWEHAGSGRTVNELMQKALDEIEALTGSLIGFYHFVDPDRNNLTLRAWSTRTREVFCKAEGEGRHYPLAEAGVWADCVREGRPLIHNDYASLPGKRGLPPGHAALVRELVVPTMRDGRVVAVLGVGNKPADYGDKDVVLVSYIADLIWTIVERKRMDEEIRRLNGRLARQANTDELTGLANRRAFFARGAEEIKRSRRHGQPLSLIMLDLDHFKDVNDSYGHDVGDRVLFCVARTLMANVREIDAAARLGGEEFGVLLPNTKPEDAVALAERVRRTIAMTDCGAQATAANVSASLGVAALTDSTRTIDDLLKQADIAMYQAKREGRNRVCCLE